KAAKQAKADAKKAKEDADKAIGDAKIQAEEELKAAKDREKAAALAAAAAEKRAQDLQAQLDALKTGLQHLSVDATALSEELGVKTTTTRNFAIRSTSDVDARADLALEGFVQKPVAIKVSGANDVDTENGFKAYEGTVKVLDKGDMAYTSIYKDFGNGIMRIVHIDSTAANGAVPVDGVAVVGNKTATLPSEGTFDYAGDATNRKVGVDNAVEYGSSEFTADFVAKK